MVPNRRVLGSGREAWERSGRWLFSRLRRVRAATRPGGSAARTRVGVAAGDRRDLQAAGVDAVGAQDAPDAPLLGLRERRGARRDKGRGPAGFLRPGPAVVPPEADDHVVGAALVPP